MEVEGKDLPRLARRWEREGWGKEDFGEAAKKKNAAPGSVSCGKGVWHSHIAPAGHKGK